MAIDPADWKPSGVEVLEDRAWEALRETNRNVCVTAGAGAGKTEFLAQKAVYLLQTGLCPPPKRILAISFKRDAAETLAKRVGMRCNDDLARRFVSMTFDAFTKSIVDQFRNALPEIYRPPFDYELTFTTDRQLGDLIQRARITGLNASQLSSEISRARLPVADLEMPQHVKHGIEAFWHDQYHGSAQTYLTFPMINRLAEYLVRTNARIRSALRSTYAAVFLDEFQDTTVPQFSFMMSAFGPTGTIYTAVGDDKQRIMGWAGAMRDAFGTFTQRCNAVPISLLSNWRSHDDLVAVQHVIAQRLDPDVERPVARRDRTVDGNVCAIWAYDTAQEEREGLANWLKLEIDGGLAPEDFAILIRMKADQVETELAPALAEHGLVLRNLARNVGEISIQELLVEELTEAVLPFLQLGCTRKHPAAWSQALEMIRRLDGSGDGDEIELQQLNSRTERIAKEVRRFMTDNAPSATTAAELLKIVIGEIGEGDIRRANPAYHRQRDYERVHEGLGLLLNECATGAVDWPDTLSQFTGTGQISLMTIHKSKGMEFHTMIFLGLDQGWWSLKPGKDEELSSFFVAFTRAEQRAFFTSCRERGGGIRWLEQLLGDGVPRMTGPLDL